MQSYTESEYLDANSVIQAYPISAFASSALQFQTITGDTELRCAVSLFFFLQQDLVNFLLARDHG